MSQVVFSEQQSADPVEQSIARKVVRILNDRSLDRQQRENLVRKAQRELVNHRKQRDAAQALQSKVAQTRLPKGYQARCVTVKAGEIHIGAVDKHHSFVWIDAGTAPQGCAANQASLAIRSSKAEQKGVRKDPIAERRKALGLTKAEAQPV